MRTIFDYSIKIMLNFHQFLKNKVHIKKVWIICSSNNCQILSNQILRYKLMRVNSVE